MNDASENEASDKKFRGNTGRVKKPFDLKVLRQADRGFAHA